jgi:outer membrane autotransporter protein
VDTHTRIVTHAYVGGTAQVAYISTWLPDHSYQQADLNIRQEDAWTVFGGIDGSRFTVKDETRVDLAGATALVGLARKMTHDGGTFLFGGFLEGGFFDYKVDGIDVPWVRVVGGKGKTRSFGLGLMARETFDNKLRLEASARFGRVFNEFEAETWFIGLGYKHDYDFAANYFGGHLGIGYTKRLNDVSTLDFVARGYLTRIGGTSSDFAEGGTIRFGSTTSKKLRGGLRYTRQSSENVFWYLGAYYEHEFDHKITATVNDELVLGAPRLDGSTGVFEIGVETHPSRNHENFSFAFGFQGYCGELRGISGGIRLGYEF